MLINACTLTSINTRTQSYLYKHLLRLSHQILETDKVTTDALRRAT